MTKRCLRQSFKTSRTVSFMRDVFTVLRKNGGSLFQRCKTRLFLCRGTMYFPYAAAIIVTATLFSMKGGRRSEYEPVISLRNARDAFKRIRPVCLGAALTWKYEALPSFPSPEGARLKGPLRGRLTQAAH